MKISWGYFKESFPYICNECESVLYEKRVICEKCGKHNTLRPVTKKDYKKWKKK